MLLLNWLDRRGQDVTRFPLWVRAVGDAVNTLGD